MLSPRRYQTDPLPAWPLPAKLAWLSLSVLGAASAQAGLLSFLRFMALFEKKPEALPSGRRKRGQESRAPAPPQRLCDTEAVRPRAGRRAA